jgi:enoyl-CoA hydratase
MPWHETRGFAGIVQGPPDKPIIAAVEGFAVAGGLEIALACDLIVASHDAVLAIPEVKRGLFAGGGALLHLPRRLPYHLAMEMALTGEPQPARRLYELGLINRLVEPGCALDAALELASQITPNSPLALRTSKDVLTRQGDWTNAEAWRQMGELWTATLAAPDAREGATAFAHKRPPRWET